MIINASGTLGDTFIIILKILNKKINKINHHSAKSQVFPQIKEIYQLDDVIRLEDEYGRI